MEHKFNHYNSIKDGTITDVNQVLQNNEKAIELS